MITEINNRKKMVVFGYLGKEKKDAGITGVN